MLEIMNLQLTDMFKAGVLSCASTSTDKLHIHQGYDP